MAYRFSSRRGVGDAASTAAPVAPAVNITYNSPYGETAFDFLNQVSSLSPTEALKKYSFILGSGAALMFVGYLVFKKEGGA